MLSLFRPTSSLLGYSGAKLLFPSPLYFAFKDSCYWLFSRKRTQETTCGLHFKCALVGCTHIMSTLFSSGCTLYTLRLNSFIRGEKK